jgi:hypothetical protein
MKFWGIDRHSNHSVGVITDETDKVIVHRRCRNERDTVLALRAPPQGEWAGGWLSPPTPGTGGSRA